MAMGDIVAMVRDSRLGTSSNRDSPPVALLLHQLNAAYTSRPQSLPLVAIAFAGARREGMTISGTLAPE
jgi:hypothetical protein